MLSLSKNVFEFMKTLKVTAFITRNMMAYLRVMSMNMYLKYEIALPNRKGKYRPSTLLPGN